MSGFGSGKTGANKKGKIDVFVNDQTNNLFQYHLTNEQKTDILLTAPISKNDTVISVSSGHGFTGADGELITIFENNRYIQSHVVLVDVNDITIETPSAFDVTTSAIVTRSNHNINVDGSTTQKEFIFNLRDFTVPIDISKIIILSTHTSQGDYSKFMGISEITSGLWFRKEDGMDFNLGNYRNNKDFRLKGAEVDFPDKAPTGVYATEVVFDLIDIFGQVIRFDAREDDIFKGTVRDDLSGLTSMYISLIGSYTDEP